jgi:hypothetical protein
VKIYRIKSLKLPAYANPLKKGSWRYPEGSPQYCPECSICLGKRVPPLIMEWEAGSNLISDFFEPKAWIGENNFVVTQQVKLALEGKLSGFEFLPVEIVQNPQLIRPKRETRLKNPRVWLPYRGPALWELWVTGRVKLDLARSEVIFEQQCKTCGRSFYRFMVKNHPELNDLAKGNAFSDAVLKYSFAREKLETGKLAIDPNSWRGEGFFRIEEFPEAVYVTETVKNFLEQPDLFNLNIGFMEEGSIAIEPVIPSVKGGNNA